MGLREFFKKLKYPGKAVKRPPYKAGQPLPPLRAEPKPESDFQSDFVLRLPDRSFYRGPGTTPGSIERTHLVEQAHGFPSRWQAAEAASQSKAFSGSWILIRADLNNERREG
jgi:hypothetical protein